jgi:prephenate dehydrogenase
MPADGFAGPPFPWRSGGEKPVVAIWGVGLIGGSLGMAWRRAGAVREVIGISREEARGAGPADQQAVLLGAVDRLTTDVQAALASADVLVLAMPVRAMIQLAPHIGPRIPPGMLVTDVGSTKAAVVAAWEAHLAPGAVFVGGHPMFGRERSGVAHASPDLPRSSRYILTPGARSRPWAVAALTALAEAAGCNVCRMTPAEHDAKVAVISHLPQAVATALAAAAAGAEEMLPGVLDLAAGGFRDTTRIAASPATLWTDIFLTNQAGLLSALAAFRACLDRLEVAVAAGDAAAIAALFAEAQQARPGEMSLHRSRSGG